jgi:hypothetical protein
MAHSLINERAAVMSSLSSKPNDSIAQVAIIPEGDTGDNATDVVLTHG